MTFANPGPNLQRRDLPHRIYASLGNNATSPERSKLFQIVSPEGEVMSKMEYLLQQAARAERLAKDVLDKLTVERLQAFADECRVQARTLASDQQRSEAA
jgi:hypothetical protein